jgi:hypothetical protein
VPADHRGPLHRWAEILFFDQIAVGCNAQGQPPAFCPLQLIPNEQMAPFIVKAFGLPVLP